MFWECGEEVGGVGGGEVRCGFFLGLLGWGLWIGRRGCVGGKIVGNVWVDMLVDIL